MTYVRVKRLEVICSKGGSFVNFSQNSHCISVFYSRTEAQISHNDQSTCRPLTHSLTLQAFSRTCLMYFSSTKCAGVTGNG